MKLSDPVLRETDVEIAQTIQQRLSGRIRGLQIRVEPSGRLTLSGVAPSFYVKQLATEIVMMAAAQHDIANLIQVLDPCARRNGIRPIPTLIFRKPSSNDP